MRPELEQNHQPITINFLGLAGPMGSVEVNAGCIFKEALGEAVNAGIIENIYCVEAMIGTEVLNLGDELLPEEAINGQAERIVNVALVINL